MRIAIVDDRPLAVEAVRRVVTRVPGYEVAWVARDGEEAVRRCAADRPDLVLMDLVMPGVNGAEATRRIMAASPCPILVVTATVSGNYGLVYEALGAGAVDAVNTPTLGLDGSTAGGEALLAKIAQVARKLAAGRPDPSARLPAGPPLVAIGASTGGPQALAELLAEFPPDLSAAVVVAQHIDAEFTAGLAGWVRDKTRLPTRLAVPNDRPEAGTVLLAGTNDHLTLRPDRTLGYTPYPTDTPFRPSIDVLFDSLSTHWPQSGVAVLLTGMGRDGADGLLKLRRAGWATFAQEPGSCAVAGMPGAAIQLGAAAHVLPPAGIGKAIAGLIRRN